MYVIGLTGSIGMGKSTAAKLFKKLKIPTYSADDSVHRLMESDKPTIKKILTLFPESGEKKINRQKISNIIFTDIKRKQKLESIIHPLVKKDILKFIQTNKKSTAIILDIPLLFETKLHQLCALTLCVTTPKKQQKERVLARHGMTLEKFKAICSTQTPDAEKTKRATVVLKNNKDITFLEQQIRAFLIKLEFGYFAKKAHKPQTF
jgi:dephospho-CoA kinase